MASKTVKSSIFNKLYSILDQVEKALIVWFQKLSIPPPRKGFFLRLLHLSGNSSQASYIYLSFWAFENPPPPRNFQSLLCGKYGYFLELHIVTLINFFISECRFNSCLLKCGDNVIVSGGNDEYFVGCIEKLYKLEEAKDPNRAVVQWYFTYEELMKLNKKVAVDVPEPWRELFLPCSEHVKGSMEDIDAETISRKCTVLKLKLKDLPPDSLNCDKEKDLFYVRYKFDHHYNLYPVNKKIAGESSLKREPSLTITLSNTKTPKASSRRLSSRNQTPLQENTFDNARETPQAKRTPARRKRELHFNQNKYRKIT